MNRVLFSIGSFNIYWYSFLILLAVVIGSFIAVKYAKNKTTGQTFITDLIFILIPTSIIGARIYYVIFNFDVYKNDLLSIFKIWEGGLAIYGAVITAILVILYQCKKYDKSFIETLDILAPSLILGQAIGRWGNFFNMEAYGPKTSLTFLHSLHLPQFIIDGMYIGGNYHVPTFFYESIGCLIVFIILIILRNKKSTKIGIITSIYFILYGLVRFFIEGLRTDSLMFFGLKIAQIVSLIGIIIGIIIIVTNRNKKYYNEMEVK